MAIKSFRDILAYQNAVKTLPQTNKVIDHLSVHDKRWLADQTLNAAHSVPANIAEGYGHKDNEKDFKRYLRIAMGSCDEVIARLETALKSGYIDSDTYAVLVAQWTIVGKELNKLVRNWRTF